MPISEQDAETIQNLIELKESKGWKIIQNYLSGLSEQAKDSLLSSEISAVPKFSEGEIIRREYKYLKTLLAVPDDLIKALQPSSNDDGAEDDPMSAPTKSVKESEDDPMVDDPKVPAPSAPII